MPNVSLTLIGKPGCHLCDDARDVITAVIAELGSSLSARGATVIDAAGLQALPGLVDLHTHLREPGFEQSETVLTGSRAAAAGGDTARDHLPGHLIRDDGADGRVWRRSAQPALREP